MNREFTSILNKLEEHSSLFGDRIALQSENFQLSYRQLNDESNKLAGYISKTLPNDSSPVVVYGHKNPRMIVAFLAALKSGRAYVPIDVNLPKNRINNILDKVNPSLVIGTEPWDCPDHINLLDIGQSDALDSYNTEAFAPCQKTWVEDDDVCYILFTSGSTGTPKGVEITYNNLNNFIQWIITHLRDAEESVVINQAPFSFDLSVMDLYISLYTGSTLWMLSKGTQDSYKALYQSLKESNATTWVSTPSFAEMCLADRSFSCEMLPKLGVFLFCGETLTNKTAAELLKRFPQSAIYNTYGPTESTVAVTSIQVTQDVIESQSPLPVGRAKPGTTIKIKVTDGEQRGNETQGENVEQGEIVIIGNTVAKGYYENREATDKAFYEEVVGSIKEAAYLTGDKGYLVDGMLFYAGRLDLQVKLHGYRMELEDIEENMMKVPGLRRAVVMPKYEEGKVKSLKAFCLYDIETDNNRIAQKNIKAEMRKHLPEYMIPAKIVVVDSLPMTANGKIDRKKLEELEK